MRADRERVWRALVRYLDRPPRAGVGLATALGCRDRAMNGSIEHVGSTIVGFRVERAARPSELALGGRHRFSRYALTFAIDDAGAGRSRLTAISDAEFPGLTGAAYKAMVVGSRMHVRAVRAILARVRSLAEAGG